MALMTRDCFNASILNWLDMYLTRLSQADGILCRWRFKRPAYVAGDLAGNDAFQADYAEGDYADEG